MASKLCVIAAGGTGGHMFPAQALAEILLARGWRVKLSTDIRGLHYSCGFPEGIEREIVTSATPSRGGRLAKLAMPFRILWGIGRAKWSFLRDRPDVVIGFGGYPTLPAMTAAWVLRRPRMLHEANGVLGRVNRFFAGKVDLVACGIWPTELPKRAVGEYCGNPVRAAVRERAGAAYTPPGDWPMNLLVFGGSQGASLMTQYVPEALAMLPKPLRARLSVSHQARDADRDLAETSYDAIDVKADIRPFFDDIPALMAEAQLVISRAGASSIADLTVIGRPAILIPLAIATNDHQTANARGLVEKGGAFAIAESELTPEVLSRHIGAILSDPEGAEAMAREAQALAVPDAAERLADMVEELAQKKVKA